MADYSFDSNYYDDTDSGDSSGSGVTAGLFGLATQLGTVALEANANPANTAILNGQSVNSPGFSTSVPLGSQFGFRAGGSSSFLLILAVAAGAFFFLRKKG